MSLSLARMNDDAAGEMGNVLMLHTCEGEHPTNADG